MEGKRVFFSPRARTGGRGSASALTTIKKTPRNCVGVDGFFFNTVKKLQMREISSKRRRSFQSMRHAYESFRTIALQVRFIV